MIIRYVSVFQELDQADFQALQKKLPDQLRAKNDRYLHYLDRQRNLFGLLLLKMLWKKQFGQELELELLQTTAFKRPYLPNSSVDFNISHAGNYVICALGSNLKLGVDVENRKEVDFDDFTRTMNPTQWNQILAAADPVAEFFKYWSIKESVIKADGRGLSIPLTEIIIHPDTVSYSDQSWHIKPFQLDPEHFGCLASDREITELNIEQIHWSDL
jgi:4'-phosphopantetheinyl transferase